MMYTIHLVLQNVQQLETGDVGGVNSQPTAFSVPCNTKQDSLSASARKCTCLRHFGTPMPFSTHICFAQVQFNLKTFLVPFLQQLPKKGKSMFFAHVRYNLLVENLFYKISFTHKQINTHTQN